MARILVIDDDETVRGLLVLLLQRLGHEVTMAVDGTEGLKLFATQPFDLTLTDMIMPGKDGIEVILGIRKLAPHARIVAMSGGQVLAPENYLKLAGHLGADSVLLKPFEIAELQVIIHKMLAKE